MRIISGQYKGRIIKPLKNLTARPTTDIAKESLFNIMNNYFDFTEVKVLDLFSGTGSISFEFASRGSMSITSVELDFKLYAYIKKTIAEFKFFQINAFRADAFKFIQMSNQKYDIIFADPPYDSENIDTIPNLIFEKNMIKEDGWLVLEHSNRFNFAEHKNFRELRKYGKVHFSIFENKEISI